MQGLISGIVGWLPQMIFTYTIFSLHLGKFKYADFAAITVLNHKTHGVVEFLFAEFLVLAMQGLLGIAFSMLLKIICSPSILLKGGLYGVILWVSIYSTFALFKIRGIYQIMDFNTAFLHCIAAIIWGITTAWTFLFLNRKYGLNN